MSQPAPPGRQDFQGALYAFAQLVGWLSITPGNTWLLRVLAAIFVGAAYVHLVVNTTTGDGSADLGLGGAIFGQLLALLDFSFFTDPDTLHDYYRPISGHITEKPFKTRLLWAINLAAGARGIGWSYEPVPLPPRPHPATSRTSFVSTRLAKTAGFVLLEAFWTAINASNPALTTPGKLLTEGPLLQRALGCAGFAIPGYARINALYCASSAIVVGLGFSKPERWPNLFGSWSNVWSIQRVWRHFWHQLLRKSVTGTTTFILENICQLKLPPPPSASDRKGYAASSLPILVKLLRLHISFILVGLIHIGGEYMLLGYMWPWTRGALWFFWAQALGITIEVAVKEGWKALVGRGGRGTTNQQNGIYRANEKQNGAYVNGFRRIDDLSDRPTLWKQLVGYLWVAGWTTYTLAYMIDPMVTTGFFTKPAFDLRTNGWLDFLLS